MKQDEEHLLQGLTAGFVTRMFAYIVDMLIVTGLLALAGWIALLLDNLIERLGIELRIDMSTIYVFMIPFIIVLYYVMFWSLTGRTIGKWFMGLKVVGLNGRPPTIGRSILRIIGYGLSAVVFWLGYLWVIIDDERQGWHDHMARTWVVYDYARRTKGETYEEYLTESGSI
ncbi:MAG: RDD family protein [Acidimicrobiia bacterium]